MQKNSYKKYFQANEIDGKLVMPSKTHQKADEISDFIEIPRANHEAHMLPNYV